MKILFILQQKLQNTNNRKRKKLNIMNQRTRE